MATVTFSLDTETGKASASIDGMPLPSCNHFSYYGYKGGFDLSVCEESSDKDGIMTSVTHRAYAGKLIRSVARDLSKNLADSLGGKTSKKS